MENMKNVKSLKLSTQNPRRFPGFAAHFERSPFFHGNVSISAGRETKTPRTPPASLAPVNECVVPAPVEACKAPAPVNEHVTPSLAEDDEFWFPCGGDSRDEPPQGPPAAMAKAGMVATQLTETRGHQPRNWQRAAMRGKLPSVQCLRPLMICSSLFVRSGVL